MFVRQIPINSKVAPTMCWFVHFLGGGLREDGWCNNRARLVFSLGGSAVIARNICFILNPHLYMASTVNEHSVNSAVQEIRGHLYISWEEGCVKMVGVIIVQDWLLARWKRCYCKKHLLHIESSFIYGIYCE